MNARIESVFAWEALDSRGKPTVGCEVKVAGGATGEAIVPSGASTGRHEAVELRDGGERYRGHGVARAVANVNEVIAPALIGQDAGDQRGIDATLEQLDGTPELSRLGANAALSVSIASAIASATHEGVPLYRHLDPEGPSLLPMPMINIVSGGAHAAKAVDLQDFLVIPVGATSFIEAIEWCSRVRASAVEVALKQGLASAVLAADEGGLGAPLTSNLHALELVAAAIDGSGLSPGHEVAIAIDVAATQLVADGGYLLAREGRTLTASEWVEVLSDWVKRFPIVSVEDPCGEDDWAGWKEATDQLGRIQMLGDDLFATSGERLQRGISDGVANAVLVKPNQAGTLSRARDVCRTALSSGYAAVVSARSGDTEDSWLADIAIGWRAGQIKVGSLTRSERTAKWNRILRIESELGSDANFAGREVLGGVR